MMKEPTDIVRARVEQGLLQKIDARCAELHVTRSVGVRWALLKWDGQPPTLHPEASVATNTTLVKADEVRA